MRRPLYVAALAAGLGVGWAVLLASPKPLAQQQAPADLLVVNGKVYSADAKGSFHEAVAVRGNRIAAVGTTQDLESLRGPKTVVLDAGGRAVMPGFNDVHTHILSGGLDMDNVNLQGAGELSTRSNCAFAPSPGNTPTPRG